LVENIVTPLSMCKQLQVSHLEAFFSSMTKLFSLLCSKKRPKSSQMFGGEYCDTA